MIDHPTEPRLDHDDDPERPDPDWKPEGEAFEEVPVDTDDQADVDHDLPDPEVPEAFAFRSDEPDILRRFARELPDSIRPALRTFLDTGVVTETFESFLMENTERISAFLGDDPYRLDERDEDLWPVAKIWHNAFEQAEARSRNSF